MDMSSEAIEYLARSDHRVEVLDAICSAPRTRDDIRKMSNASRVTAGRIIADLEERGWIIRKGKEYEATMDGQFVAREFIRMRENLRTYADLPPLVEWLPGGEPEFDLHLLRDAKVITADEGDLMAPIHRALELIERSDHLNAVGNGASPEFIEAIRAAVEDGQTHAMIGPPTMVEALRNDPDQRDDMHAILESGRGRLFQFEGDTDLPVIQIGDDSVAFCSGDHRAMIETENERVYGWATSYFDSLRNQSTTVPADVFEEERTLRDDEVLIE